jgi:hypothetical protein
MLDEEFFKIALEIETKEIGKCKECGKGIPNKTEVGGEVKRVKIGRTYCLDCSPFGSRERFYGEKEKQRIIDGKLKCLICKEDKRLDNYYNRSNRDSKNPYCKPCWGQIQQDKIRNKKLQFIDYKGGCCQICNYNQYPGALDFHHLNPKEKEEEIADLAHRSFENAKDELDKCILVCATCHREIHGGLHPHYLILE